MNEELKIIIKAVTDEAKKNLADVRKELDNIDKEGSEAGKAMDEAMRAVGKGAAIAAGAIAALTTAMIALGKTSVDFQKQQAKLIAGFQAAGSSAQQAQKTYMGLFRFLGESDQATEAAQSLARITTNTEDLAEWTKILQGVYARAGDAIPVESLAEAANETIKVGQVTGSVADALNWLGVSEDAFNEKLAQTNSLEERELLLRSTLNSLYGNAAAIYERNNQALIRYQESQANVDLALAQAAQYLVPLMTELNELAAILLQVLKPAFETISAVIIVFVQWIIAAIQYIGAFFGMFQEGADASKTVSQNIAQIQTSTSGLTSGAQDYGNALGKAAKQAEQLKKQTMGFDELNVVSSQQSASIGTGGGSGGAGGGSGGINIPSIEGMDFELPALEDFTKKMEEVKERMQGVLVLVGLVGAAFLAWKLAPIIKDIILINTKISTIKKLWGDEFVHEAVEALDRMDSLKAKLKSIGGTAAIVAGALALIYGYSDAWANGIDWGNFAIVLAGIGAIVGGLTLKFGAKAGAVGTLVGGISLLILGIKDFVENGYSMEAVITIAVGAITVLVGAVWAFNSALLANPITWVVAAIMALVAVFVILWNECEGFRNFWIQLWEGIKKAFSATVDWFKQAGKDIAKFFVDAWNNIKKAFSSVSSFFTGIYNSIKKIFSNVGSAIAGAITNTVKTAINGVLSTAVKIINGFISAINLAIDVINAIPGVHINALTKLSVPKLARGGIVDSATIAMIGERGKEAVLPLENNTGWMDALAERIAARNSTPTKLYLMVDKKELGYVTIDSINGITKQTGKLQLVY